MCVILKLEVGRNYRESNVVGPSKIRRNRKSAMGN